MGVGIDCFASPPSCLANSYSVSFNFLTRTYQNIDMTAEHTNVQVPNSTPESDLHRPTPAPLNTQVTRLENTYTSQITQLGIALPVDEEFLKRTQSLALARLHLKGTRAGSFLQQIQGERNGIDANKIHHTLWVGRKWDSILCLFDSVVRKLGKQQSAFKPYGLMVLLKASYT